MRKMLHAVRLTVFCVVALTAARLDRNRVVLRTPAHERTPRINVVYGKHPAFPVHRACQDGASNARGTSMVSSRTSVAPQSCAPGRPLLNVVAKRRGSGLGPGRKIPFPFSRKGRDRRVRLRTKHFLLDRGDVCSSRTTCAMVNVRNRPEFVGTVHSLRLELARWAAAPFLTTGHSVGMGGSEGPFAFRYCKPAVRNHRNCAALAAQKVSRVSRRIAYAGGKHIWAAPAGGTASGIAELWRTDGPLLRTYAARCMDASRDDPSSVDEPKSQASSGQRGIFALFIAIKQSSSPRSRRGQTESRPDGRGQSVPMFF